MSEKEGNWIWILIVLVIVIGMLPLLFWGPWGGYMHGMMGYGWGFVFLIPVAFLALTALGAYCLITGFTRNGRSSSGDGERALVILKERYAKDEITREEYLKMKEELES